MSERVLVLSFDGPRALKEQEEHLQHAGLFVPAPDPAPEQGERVSLRITSPYAEPVSLSATVVQLFGTGSMALGLEDADAAAGAMAAHFEGAAKAGGEEGAASAAWGSAGVDLTELATTAAETQPEQSGEEAEGTLYDRVRAMSVPEKRQVALKGGRAERLFILKDPNKTLQSFVLRNPRVTLDEVRALATNRQASAEALKMISENKQWMQTPSIVSGLVRNPKTPSPIAVRLLDKLSMSEIRQLAKASSTPKAVVIAAKKRIMRGK
jgi:hypothetical protein